MEKTNVVEEEVQEVTSEVTALELLNRSEIRQQIATAREFPRSLRAFLREGKEMACLNQKVAAACTYALPRDGGHVTGPSARFAEIVASAWGNCRAGARTIGEEGDFIVAQGGFMDMERNVHITFEVRRRIVNRKGERFNADMIGMTANAACSIALRNAVLKGVPKAYWEELWDASKQVAAGDGKSLEESRQNALKAFKSHGVGPDQICEHLGVAGIADIGIDELIVLQGLLTSINEGETTVKSIFPSVKEPKRAAGKAEQPAGEQPASQEATTQQVAQKPPQTAAPAADVKLIVKSEVGMIVGLARKKKAPGTAEVFNDESLLQWLFSKFQIDGGPAKVPQAQYNDVLKSLGELPTV